MAQRHIRGGGRAEVKSRGDKRKAAKIARVAVIRKRVVLTTLSIQGKSQLTTACPLTALPRRGTLGWSDLAFPPSER